MAANSGKNRRVMPKGKPFVKGDARINRKGAPPRGQSWQETIKRLTDMTREEAIEYVGANTQLGRQLKELPPDVSIKDAMILAVIIAFGREPNARMLAAIMDRTDGKVTDKVEQTGEVRVIIEYADDNTIAEIAPGPAADQEPEA